MDRTKRLGDLRKVCLIGLVLNLVMVGAMGWLVWKMSPLQEIWTQGRVAVAVMEKRPPLPEDREKLLALVKLLQSYISMGTKDLLQLSGVLGFVFLVNGFYFFRLRRRIRLLAEAAPDQPGESRR